MHTIILDVGEVWHAYVDAPLHRLDKVAFKNVLTPWLMQPGGSMQHSQGLSNNPYPEPNQPNSPHWYLSLKVGLGGLGVTCLPRDPRFAGSNPTEVDGFFEDVKILSTSPPGGTLSWGSRVWDFRLVKEPQAWKNRPLKKLLSAYSRPSNI